MNASKYSGGLTALLDLERERREREALPSEAPASEAPASGDREPSPERTATPEAPAPEAPTHQTPASEATAPKGTVRGYTALDNWIADDFLPRLDHYEQMVMFRLYRLTIGFNRPTCIVSQGKLAEKLRIGENTVARAVKRLESAGYIATRPVISGAVTARGLEFRILPPALPPQAPAREAPVRRATARQGDMTKNMKEHVEKPAAAAPADRYEIRRAAARLKEANKHRPAYDRAALVRDLRSSFVAQGREVSVEEIERALSGLSL